MLYQETAIASSELRLRISDADIAICGPTNVLGIVDRMLAHVPRSWLGEHAPLTINVRYDSSVWSVNGTAPAGHKTLGRLSALPRVAGAVVSSLLAELAHARHFNVWRAAAAERDGRALVLIGDDWESCVTLLAHLHTRGWRILGGDYALVAGDTFVVTAFKKVLHANSSCIDAFPSWYRRAIEASPWYSTPQVIAFYAIDPTLVDAGPPWGEQAPLHAVVRIEGHWAEHPSLEALEDATIARGLRQSDLRRAGVEVASLKLGDFIETCDLLERWFLA
jgi:hypothetical protein